VEVSPSAPGAEDDPEVVVEFVRLLRLCDKLQVRSQTSAYVAESWHDQPVPACAAFERHCAASCAITVPSAATVMSHGREARTAV